MKVVTWLRPLVKAHGPHFKHLELHDANSNAEETKSKSTPSDPQVWPRDRKPKSSRTGVPCELGRNAQWRAPPQPESESGHCPVRPTDGEEVGKWEPRVTRWSNIFKRTHFAVCVDLCGQDQVQIDPSTSPYHLYGKKEAVNSTFHPFINAKSPT